jgi:hypothetical protein
MALTFATSTRRSTLSATSSGAAGQHSAEILAIVVGQSYLGSTGARDSDQVIPAEGERLGG